MGRKLDVGLLVGTADIVQRLGLSEQRTVHAWIRRYEDFPKPVVSRERVMLWYWPDVEVWAKQTGRIKP